MKRDIYHYCLLIHIQLKAKNSSAKKFIWWRDIFSWLFYQKDPSTTTSREKVYGQREAIFWKQTSFGFIQREYLGQPMTFSAAFCLYIYIYIYAFWIPQELVALYIKKIRRNLPAHVWMEYLSVLRVWCLQITKSKANKTKLLSVDFFP